MHWCLRNYDKIYNLSCPRSKEKFIPISIVCPVFSFENTANNVEIWLNVKVIELKVKVKVIETVIVIDIYDKALLEEKAVA